MQSDDSIVTPGSAKACVIGDPIAHSRSPLIHGYWLHQLSINGHYDRRLVKSAELADFLSDIRGGILRGGNVTVPHKQEMANRLDHLTETARQLGAVNTIWEENGLLWGDNTDVTGFLANLDDRCPGWDTSNDRAVVLGAGGAARAVVFGLLQRGYAKIIVVNRSRLRADQLVSELQPAGENRLLAADWEERSALLAGTSFLVNTTTLGMSGQPALFIKIDLLPPHAVVNDIVYAPLETELLMAAQSIGLKTVDGLGMLLHQAVPGFTRWFGRQPLVTDQLRQLVISDMNRSKT